MLALAALFNISVTDATSRPGTPICVPPAPSYPYTSSDIPVFTPTVTTLTGPVTTYIDATTTIVGLGPITTDVEIPPTQDCIAYTSQAGDTCASIAAPFGLTADDIYAANTFLDCQNIWANTPICIPFPRPTATITGTFYPVPTCEFTYTSQQGDTCDTLAVRFHVTSDEILAYNSFLSCDNIWANTPICVPPMDPITTDPITITTVTDPWVDPGTTVPVPTCSVTYTSVEGDTCDSIGSLFGISGNSVYQANTFLSCNDICKRSVCKIVSHADQIIRAVDFSLHSLPRHHRLFQQALVNSSQSSEKDWLQLQHVLWMPIVFIYCHLNDYIYSLYQLQRYPPRIAGG